MKKSKNKYPNTKVLCNKGKTGNNQSRKITEATKKE
jgi:hypothetical protein